MRYKSRVSSMVENLLDTLRNTKEGVEKDHLSREDVLDALRSSHSIAQSIEQYVQLEENNFSQNEGPPAPGSQEAQTPPREAKTQRARKSSDKQTRRVEDTSEAGNTTQTKKVKTQKGDRKRKKDYDTKRVEFDD